MAAANPVQSLQEETTCPICLEYYTDPVITQCGHNFCRPCALSACSQEDGTPLSCPQCRQLCPQGDLRVNRQLQSMVELVKQLSLQQERTPGEGLCAEQQQRPTGEGLCAKHDERLKLFCKEDEKLICVICRESKEHKAHMIHPIEEAAEEYKPKLQKQLQILWGELGAVHWSTQEEEKDCKAMRNKLEAERKKIDAEFRRQRKLLNEQQAILHRRLENMDKKIVIVENANLAKLLADMSSLEALITEIEKKCEQPAEELLKDIRSTLRRCENVMDQASTTNVKKYRALVTLDEDTAHERLVLSEGGRRVRCTYPQQGMPDNPKRFTFYTGVVGREGYTAGRYYWELQIPQYGEWTVGVIRESVDRKKGVTLSPEMGAWTVCGYDGWYGAFTTPGAPQSSHQCPTKLGLYLDCRYRRLSVYNADTMEALYTITGAAFNGRVYPFFRVCGSADLCLV